MPGFDGTGPLGLGPLTGRGRGYCRLGLGRRFARRMRFFEPGIQPLVITEPEEKRILQAELKEIEEEKKEIQKRLKELEE
ncbi:hypothetical protein DRN69_07755 [Candidatus Pacearchaeota archaeon]|nr:MAG: hypothetical protein DRN69_07755 [Candidatus Pacearchaeota archaeon]